MPKKVTLHLKVFYTMLALSALFAPGVPTTSATALEEPRVEMESKAVGKLSFDKVFADRHNAPERFGASEQLWRNFVDKGHLAKVKSVDREKGSKPMICDIGAADGSLTEFIAKRFDMNAHAYDIVQPDKNLYTVGKTMWPVALYDGKHIPEEDGACDIVLFAYVLHHAADSTFKLLQEAARVTRPGTGHVLMTEDLADHHDAVRQARNLMHDTHGIFRTDGEWQALLQAMGLQLKDTGRLFGSENPQTYYISQPNATVAKL